MADQSKKKFYFPFCFLAFSTPLSYSPRHVSLRNFIRQHRLGVPVASLLERTDRNIRPTGTRYQKRLLISGGVFNYIDHPAVNPAWQTLHQLH